jgi:hypothetical protein
MERPDEDLTEPLGDKLIVKLIGTLTPEHT